jgi:hypothetical protein
MTAIHARTLDLVSALILRISIPRLDPISLTRLDDPKDEAATHYGDSRASP